MDNFKVPFCLFGENKLRPQRVLPNHSRTKDQPTYQNDNRQAIGHTFDGKIPNFPIHRNASHLFRIHIGRLALIAIGLLVPGYLAGCGGGASLSSEVIPPASTSSGTGAGTANTGVTATGTGSLSSGGSGTGTTATSTTGTDGTGTGSTGGSGTGTTATSTTGTGGTGTPGIVGIQDIIVSSTDVNSRLTYGSVAGDWKPVCIEPECSPGGTGVPTATSQTINNTSPSKDEKSMRFSLSSASNSAYTNALWVNVSGDCDNCTRVNSDFWIYITSTAGYVNTHEFDSFIFDKMHGYKNMWGMQCVNGGNWEIDSDFGWSSVGIACNLTVGWHHIRVFNHRIINEVGGPKGFGYNYYDALIVDGVYNDLTGKTTPAEAYPPTYTQSTSGFQFQLDANKNPTPVTIDEYLDLANFYGGN